MSILYIKIERRMHEEGEGLEMVMKIWMDRRNSL
jgi:hypothetical protein